MPARLLAGQTVEVRVIVRNTGKQTWHRGRTKLGYHWYHLDGTEMDWEGAASPMKMNLQPGAPVVVLAQVTAPEYDGQYVLLWDVMIDDQWLSTYPLSRGGDILPVFVEVTGGRLAFVDLAEAYDVPATSPDTGRTAGDFDGAGASFPAELMPPDAGVTDEVISIYPSGYKWDWASRPDGRISFSYPSKVPGASSAIACAGQVIDVEDGSYVALHVLGASTNGDASGELSLDYTGDKETAAIEMSDWGGQPSHGEMIGYVTRHRHTHGGDDTSKRCCLHHYVISLDPEKTLTWLKLPDNADMKIIAVTLERAALPPPESLKEATEER